MFFSNKINKDIELNTLKGEETILWDSSIKAGIIPLSSSINNFREITVVYGFDTGNGSRSEESFRVSSIDYDSAKMDFVSSSSYVSLTFTSSTSITVDAPYCHIYKIIGIK